MRNLLSNLRVDRRGTTIIEYVLITGLISVTCIALLSAMGTSVKNVFGVINNTLTSA
jgi:pilus assembly protein Flp/PilA